MSIPPWGGIAAALAAVAVAQNVYSALGRNRISNLTSRGEPSTWLPRGKFAAVAVAQNVYSALGRNSGCGDSRRTPLALAVAPYLLSALGRNGGGWGLWGAECQAG